MDYVFVEVGMKTLPKLPYLQNIVQEYRKQSAAANFDQKDYIQWLQQFGFAVPVREDRLEFPDEFSDEQLMMFILRFS